MSRVQLNARVNPKLKTQVATDKAQTNTPHDIIVEVALDLLFKTFKQSRRAELYKAHYRKPYEVAR